MDYLAEKYDVIIIGGGHAGIEAALAASRIGKTTAMFVMNLDGIANMACNPSIGGTSKGHLVREIDALGGQMGMAADECFIQSKMLNKSKGPAVHSLRAQIDRTRYREYMKQIIENQKNLDVYQNEIIEIIIKNQKVEAIKTKTGAIYKTKALVVSTGTYLRGKIIVGDVSYESGPDGLFPANDLSKSLKKNKIDLFRFKTGTPARININNIDLSEMEIQKGDKKTYLFSFSNEENKKIKNKKQANCYLTYTNVKTHNVIKANINRSPLFNGGIEGAGPRYCPSIEDKVIRFSDKERHQVFIEPMGENTNEMYIQGMSSSLPEEVQKEMYQTIKGLEKSKLMRTAYAIEYDVIDPTKLTLGLRYRDVEGLYFAGQINGSSGYEEAAAQGLIAGINAARGINKKTEFILNRAEAYIGVLIDDLVTKGTKEPYRMMTSRAEYRLILRQDNADLRLTEKGHKLGLIKQERYESFIKKKKLIEGELERLKSVRIKADKASNKILKKLKSAPISKGVKLSELLKRTEITYLNTKCLDKKRKPLQESIQEQVDIHIKYEGYIKLQEEQIKKFKKTESKKIPLDIDYKELKGLSLEARQKLNNQRPLSIGQASRISGVSPADISVLLMYLKQIETNKQEGFI